MQKPYWQQWTCSKLLKLLLVLLFVQSYAKVELNDLHLNLNVEKFQLENGISVCLIARHRSPIVMQQVWYNVGSGDEHDGITGVSHFLEHMMFKGTPLYPSGAFNQELKKIGAQYNAFTSQDFTVYHEIVLRENLEKVINLEADRMRNLDIELSLMEKERKVITEERRSRTEDDPYALARESFYLHAYEGNPYQSPVIGHMRSIHNVTKAKLQHWYNSYYTPSNVTLIYIGDIKKKELKQLFLM